MKYFSNMGRVEYWSGQVWVTRFVKSIEFSLCCSLHAIYLVMNGSSNRDNDENRDQIFPKLFLYLQKDYVDKRSKLKNVKKKIQYLSLSIDQCLMPNFTFWSKIKVYVLEVWNTLFSRKRKESSAVVRYLPSWKQMHP